MRKHDSIRVHQKLKYTPEFFNKSSNKTLHFFWYNFIDFLIFGCIINIKKLNGVEQMINYYFVDKKIGVFWCTQKEVQERTVDGVEYYFNWMNIPKKKFVLMNEEDFNSQQFRTVRTWTNVCFKNGKGRRRSVGRFIEHVGTLEECTRVKDELEKKYQIMPTSLHSIFVEVDMPIRSR